MNDTYLHHMECLLRVLVYIEDHLGEELSLDKMAKIAHISPFYFHRLFHAYMGETLSDYVIRLRMQRASEKLNYTDIPVTEIALELGYGSPSSFTKAFNQILGESPREFRKSMRPIVEAMLKRVPQDILQGSVIPKYVQRKEEEVLFVRKVGPYSETPWKAFVSLLAFLKQENISRGEIKTFYSMGLDDPQFVPHSKCRFDACVVLKKRHIPKGEVGIKILPGGKCAVFEYKGSYSGIEAFFHQIFRTWYPSAHITLADTAPFCEHLEIGDESVPMVDRTTYLYIPLAE